MLWIILLLTAQRARYTGWTSVAVRCEGCERKYYYELKRTARAESSSQDTARRLAKQRLLKKLDNDIDPVPCPHCGSYQEEMWPLLRKMRLRWMIYVGLAGVLLSAGFVLPLFIYLDENTPPADKPSPTIAIVCALSLFVGMIGSLSLFFLRGYMNKHYDPNEPETLEERLKLGGKRSITRAEAEDLADPVIRRE
jgi:hypothetical protein